MIGSFAARHAYSFVCALLLVVGSVLLTAIGGEAGGDHALPWLAALSALTLVWLFSLQAKTVSPALLLGVALVIRIVFLCMPTGYDTYRYLWEGRILFEGFNPYVHPPNDAELSAFRDESWKSVSHPGATAIYPPFAQFLFAAMAPLGMGLLGIKIVFAAADLILCALLCRKFGAHAAVIYSWNPLAAVSFAGGGHYDSLFILAMVIAWLAFRDDDRFPWFAGLLIGAAIGLKWMAAPLGIWLVFHLWRNHGAAKAVMIGGIIAAPVVLSWIAISAWTGEWTLQLMPPVFSRVARSAEFIPVITDYLFRSGQLHNRWYMAAIVIGWIIVALKSRSLQQAAEWGFLVTFLLAPMMHAWYFVWALPFAVRSKNLGFIALAASGILYFLVHHNMEQPGGSWTFTWWQRCLIWFPFIIGFAASARKKRAVP